MGRKRLNHVYQYFDYNENTKMSKCRMENCGQVLRGNHGANLLRHFHSQHRVEYDKIVEKNSENKENETPNTSRNLINIIPTTLSTVTDNCVKLVTVHGRPFSILDDDAFKNILSLIPDLRKQDLSMLNSRNITNSIREQAYEVRRRIHAEIKDKLVCLKIDVASVKSRRFLGVNIQYILNDKIVLRNLGVIELHNRNTAAFLKENVLIVMSRYGIEIKQLYSITSDNGANMLLMSRLLDEDLQEMVDDELSDNNNIDNFDLTENQDNMNEFLDFVEEVDVMEFHDVSLTEPPKLTTVRCAAHTLQLAIREACSELEPIFIKCRTVARALRTPNHALLLRENDLPQAIIDCPTRWDSTADMVERLLTLKIFINQQVGSTFQIINADDTWEKLDECNKVLTPCRVLSKLLQKEQLTFGDFYLSWTKCILEIEKLNSPFAYFLTCCMKNREDVFKNNIAFISAIYLDARVNSILTDEQLEEARDHLVKTYQRALELSSSDAMQEPEVLPSTAEALVGTTELDTFFEIQFNRRQQSMRTFNSVNNFQRLLFEFLNQPRLPSHTNILKYWDSIKNREPQLYLLSNIVLAAPPTQVSVERLFSSLKFVVNNLRMSLKDNIIDDVLVIRNNALYNK